MTTESVKTIIGRAVVDAEYRELLFGDPDEALAGFDLTGEEAAALKGMARETFDEVAGELEERISKSGFLFDDPMLRKRPGLEPIELEITDRLLPRLFTVNLDGKG